MRFYQYWILLIAGILVLITVKNIIKLFIIFSKKDSYIDKELGIMLRNLYSSIALISIIILVIIFIVVCEN